MTQRAARPATDVGGTPLSTDSTVCEEDGFGAHLNQRKRQQSSIEMDERQTSTMWITGWLATSFRASFDGGSAHSSIESGPCTFIPSDISRAMTVWEPHWQCPFSSGHLFRNGKWASPSDWQRWQDGSAELRSTAQHPQQGGGLPDNSNASTTAKRNTNLPPR